VVTVIFRAKIKAGKEDEAVAAMTKMAEAVEKEEAGTIIYAVCRNQEEPLELIVLESYKDDDAFMAHMGSSHVANMRAAFGELFDGARVERLERVAGFARG